MTLRTPKDLGAHFAKTYADYQNHAQEQRAIAAHLARGVVFWRQKKVRRALEVGCGSGFLGASLAPIWTLPPVAQWWSNDLYPPPAFYAPARQLTPLIGDIAVLPLPSALDLVLSSSVFQWLPELEAVVAKLAAAMKRGGLFAVALYCGRHFEELAAGLGVGLDYRAPEMLVALFSAYFRPLNSEHCQTTTYFQTPRALLTYVRQAGLALWQGEVSLARLRAFPDFMETRRSAEGYPLSSDYLFFWGEKP